ncbi:MAG: hypothetical protein WCB15_21265 [Desulfobacterales bacterium]
MPTSLSKSGVSFFCGTVAAGSVADLFNEPYQTAAASPIKTRQIKGISHFFLLFRTRLFGFFVFFTLPILFPADYGFGFKSVSGLFVGWVEHPDIFCWVSFLYPTYLPAIFVLSAKPNKMVSFRSTPTLQKPEGFRAKA